MPKPKLNRNISRIDIDRETNRGTHGYQVRLRRRGQSYSKFFGDAVHGGKRAALKQAREYRDQLDAELQHYSRKEFAELHSSRNESGTVGVRLAEEVDTRWPGDPVSYYWVAQWSPKPRQQRTKRFSVDKYGYEEAFRLAVQARQQGLADMEE